MVYQFTVHYEYMALAKKTSALREAMSLFYEPQCFGKLLSKFVPTEYASIFRSHVNKHICHRFLFLIPDIYSYAL